MYYKPKRLTNTNYNDEPIKKKGIEFGKDILGLNLIVNPKQRKIDLLCEDDSELGVEVENGHWQGDFWSTDSYSKITKLEFPTINIPIRKEKYWKEYIMWYGKEKHNPSWNKNIFLRSNHDFSQIIIIRPEVITNPKKLIRTTFKANNCDEVEEWLSFKKEDVETYNLINGKYKLETI